ncbi:conserved hypothetical protein [Vibrio chagasii]|nr:conserved hypothetical protein [Vibrio chagasii]
MNTIKICLNKNTIRDSYTLIKSLFKLGPETTIKGFLKYGFLISLVFILELEILSIAEITITDVTQIMIFTVVTNAFLIGFFILSFSWFLGYITSKVIFEKVRDINPLSLMMLYSKHNHYILFTIGSDEGETEEILELHGKIAAKSAFIFFNSDFIPNQFKLKHCLPSGEFWQAEVTFR